MPPSILLNNNLQQSIIYTLTVPRTPQQVLNRAIFDKQQKMTRQHLIRKTCPNFNLMPCINFTRRGQQNFNV